MKKLFVYGKPIKGKLLPIPKSYLSNYSSVIGALYELDMDVKITDRSKLTEENFEIVKERLYKEHHAKVKYFSVDEHNGVARAVMQLQGSPFAFSALIATIVELAPLIGLTVIGIVVYYITKKHPGVMSLLVYGGILFIVFGGAKLLSGASEEEAVEEAG